MQEKDVPPIATLPALLKAPFSYFPNHSSAANHGLMSHPPMATRSSSPLGSWRGQSFRSAYVLGS